MTDRKTLLARGFYVATDVETAFLGLSGLAHDCLILLKHKQGANSEAYPPQEWLAQRLRKSVRTIQRAVAELIRKGALAVRRTGRTNRYSAVYGRCTPQELKVLLGGDIPGPQGLCPERADTSETTDPDASETTDPGGSIEEEPEKKNQEKTTTPSLREGGDAAAPHESQEEPDMPSKHQQPDTGDQLDPATALGLWDSSTDQLFPTPARQPRGRSQAQQDTPYALACEMARLLSGQTWAGPSPVNRAALARNFSAWKKDGTTAEQIRQMMTAYTADGASHSSGKPPWMDFLARRRALHAQIQRQAHAAEVEEHRYDARYWLGDLADR